VQALTSNEMISKIDAKYAQNTWLGAATTGYETLNGGMFRHYEGGSIYIGNDVGEAHEVHGHIRDKWANLGWENSFLGYPTTDELTTPDGVGRYNHFQNGSIYWYPNAGAFEVHGLIRDKWAELGWERSVLGYPLSDELDTADGQGKYTKFQNGRIYYHPTYGTHFIKYGKIYLNWADGGFETGSIGYPTSDTYTENGYDKQSFSKKTISEKDADLINKVDLTQEIKRRKIDVRTQGGRGTCALEAMTFLLEYAYAGLLNNYNHLSIDYSIQAGNEAYGETMESSCFPKYVSGYNKFGSVSNSSWPYDMNAVYNYDTWSQKLKQLTGEGQALIQKGLKLKGRYIKRDKQLVMTDRQFKDVMSCLDKGIPVAQAHSNHATAIIGYVINNVEADGGGYFIYRDSAGPGGTYTFSYYANKTGTELYVFDGVDDGVKRVKIKNRWTNQYLSTASRSGKVSTMNIDSDDVYAQWWIIPGEDGICRIKNVGTGQFLDNEGRTGNVETHLYNFEWWSSRWKLVDNSGCKNIINQWTNEGIHVENRTGLAECGTIKDDWWSAHWIIENVTELDNL